MRRSNVWTMSVVIGFLSVVVLGCSKYDKMSIQGTWEIDIKAAKGLPDSYELAKETLRFTAGNDQPYTQEYKEKVITSTGIKGREETWRIKGNVERKKDKMTFINRVKDETIKMEDSKSYQYRIEGDKLILIVENEDFPKNEKIYTKIGQ